MLAKVAAMKASDRTMAKRVHAIVKANAPAEEAKIKALVKKAVS